MDAATKRFSTPLFSLGDAKRRSPFFSTRAVSTVSTALKRPKRSFGAAVTLCLTILFVREFPSILQNFIKRLSAARENERFRKRKNLRPRPRSGRDGAPRSFVGRKTRKIGFSETTVKIATYPLPTAENRSSSTRNGTGFARFIDFNVNFMEAVCDDRARGGFRSSSDASTLFAASKSARKFFLQPAASPGGRLKRSSISIFGKRRNRASVDVWAGRLFRKSTKPTVFGPLGTVMQKFLQLLTVAVAAASAFCVPSTTSADSGSRSRGPLPTFASPASDSSPTIPPTSRSRYSPFYEPSSDALSAPTPLRSLDDLLDRKRTLDAEAETRRALPLSDDGERERALAEGDALLDAGRWLDAKKRFEKGLRAFPNDETLRVRFATARRRSELELRYQDATFVELTDGASLDDVLAVFDEATLNIDNYHVDRPAPATLFAFGFDGLVEAFAHEPFYEQNGLPFERSERAEALLTKVRDASKRWRLETDADLKSAVLWLAKRLREETGVRETATISEFLCSAVCSLDAYSAHLTPVQVEDVFSMIDGRFVGIGVELKTDDPARVVRVVPNSPASESGVEAGDEIVAVDGEPTDGLTGAEIGALLQGEVGQRATLTLRSPNDGTLRRVVAIRRQIDVPSVEDVRLLDAPGRVGYFRVVCFQKTTATEMIAAIDELSRLQMESLVVDLRQNPGGLLQEAIDVSDLFLDSGTIVRTRGRSGDHSYSATQTSFCSTPLVLLVDENSASASEIFAGAMKENGRAVVVGTQSYGKGTVQAIVQLSCPTQTAKPIAGLRLTTEKFYSPNGFAYGGVGVLPHVRVELPEPPENAASFAATNPTYSADVATETANADYAEFNDDANEVAADPFLAAAVREANRLSTRRQSSRFSTRSQVVASPTSASSRRAAPRFVGVSTER